MKKGKERFESVPASSFMSASLGASGGLQGRVLLLMGAALLQLVTVPRITRGKHNFENTHAHTSADRFCVRI